MRAAIDSGDAAALEAAIQQCNDLGVPCGTATKALRRVQRAAVLRDEFADVFKTEPPSESALVALLRRVAECSRRISCFLTDEISAALHAVPALPADIRSPLREIVPECDAESLLSDSEKCAKAKQNKDTTRDGKGKTTTSNDHNSSSSSDSDNKHNSKSPKPAQPTAGVQKQKKQKQQHTANGHGTGSASPHQSSASTAPAQAVAAAHTASTAHTAAAEGNEWLLAIESPSFPVCLTSECETTPCEFAQSDDDEEVEAMVFEDPVALRSYDVAIARMRAVYPLDCVSLSVSQQYGLPRSNDSSGSGSSTNSRVGAGASSNRRMRDDERAARLLDDLHLSEYKARLLSRGVSHEALMMLSPTELKAVGIASAASRHRLLQYRKARQTRRDYKPHRVYPKGMCVMCLEPANAKCVPCEHVALCMACSAKYMTETCPVCRRNTREAVPISGSRPK